MERTTIPAYSFGLKSYYLLTKPGILMGNAITTVAGFCLASRGSFDVWLFLATLIGLTCLIGSSCVMNNYIDRRADQKMERTKHRALANGSISISAAMIFALVMGVVGVAALALFTNPLTVYIALFGFFVYVLLYSFSKYYSMHGTLIGSVAGAVPPVVGYCAVSNHLDLGAWILFAMIVLWQMPHFYAIAIYRQRDYAAASIPVLPIKKGMRATKIQMLLYTIAFVGASSLLYVFHYAGIAYLTIALVLGLGWLWLCIEGFRCKNDQHWARQMFRFSLIVVTALSFALILGAV